MSERSSRSLITTSPDDTRAMGAALGRAVAGSPADHALVIALNGELGAGKTTFVGGFLRALGVAGAVRSPTYTLIEPYEVSGRTVYHLDLYRLADPRELEMLAPRDLLEPGSVLVVEWAERAGAALPQPDLTVTLTYPSAPASAVSESTRAIEIRPGSSAGQVLAASLHQSPNEAWLSP